MNAPDRVGFRVVGGLDAERQIVDFEAAFRACCAADPAAEPWRESYLGQFTFGRELRDYVRTNGTTRGYRGPAAARWLWLDIDRADPAVALDDARRLVCRVLEELRGLGDDDPLVFFSGGKGYHVGLPLPAVARTPHPLTPAACRVFAECVASLAGVPVDLGIYDPVRLFRAPNSRHPRTGLHKVRVWFDELMRLDAAGARKLAGAPRPFDPPADGGGVPAKLAATWAEAVADAGVAAESRTALRGGPQSVRVNRATLDFIRHGAPEGERAGRLFRAAANLGEYGAGEALAVALLEEPGLDCGLPPAEVRRQIRCGLDHAVRQRPGAGAA